MNCCPWQQASLFTYCQHDDVVRMLPWQQRRLLPLLPWRWCKCHCVTEIMNSKCSRNVPSKYNDGASGPVLGFFFFFCLVCWCYRSLFLNRCLKALNSPHISLSHSSWCAFLSLSPSFLIHVFTVLSICSLSFSLSVLLYSQYLYLSPWLSTSLRSWHLTNELRDSRKLERVSSLPRSRFHSYTDKKLCNFSRKACGILLLKPVN